MPHSILIVEDDRSLAGQIDDLLRRYDYRSSTVSDFGAIDTAVERERPDLILLDINLPKYDGFYWCRRLRELTRVPILILSARNDTADQIRGMESGADDYITKPFDPDVLLAKVNAVIRRNYGELRESSWRSEEKGGITFREERQTVDCGERSAELSLTEANLFRALFRAYPGAVSRNELFMEVWDTASFVEENTLNVNVRRLREKFAAAELPLEIRVVRSFGYRLVIGGDGE